MLKKSITYEDFEGNTHTETFYFNLSKPELIELEVENKEGFQAWIQKMVEGEDNKSIVAIFRKIVLMAYGEKSEDGKRFIKSPEMSEAFSQTNAYNELFMELITNESTIADFIINVMPKDLVSQVDVKAVLQTADPTAQPPANA